ncbi:MAG: methylmalonyl-CoA mutase family protein, partial [Myxococcales bacterium]
MLFCLRASACSRLTTHSSTLSFPPLAAPPSTLSFVLLQLIFTVETLLKIVALGLYAGDRRAYLRDGWNWLDFICVVTSYSFLMPGTGGNVSGLRAFRALRPLRTINGVPGMRLLANTLIESLPLMIDVMVLIVWMFFVFDLIGMNFFTEIAKLRAARILWAKIVHAFGAKNPKSLALRMHCQTSGWSLAAQDPYNNIVRTCLEALAGVLGGTQSLHTNALDEAIALPTEFSARIARNTQLILQEESNVTHTADPLAGSHYVEALTDELAQKAWAIIQEVEGMGGMTKAIEAGLPKLRIEESAARRQAAIDSGREAIVGVNKYAPDQQEPLDILSIDNTEVRKAQIARLKQLRADRDDDAVRAALEAITEGAKGDDNLLGLAVHAVSHGATVGEVSDAMEAVFGRHTANPKTVAGVYAAAGKSMGELNEAQQRSNAFLEKTGRRPRMLVAKMGQDGHDRGARVIASAFADMGFDVDIGPLFQTPDEVARQA